MKVEEAKSVFRSLPPENEAPIETKKLPVVNRMLIVVIKWLEQRNQSFKFLGMTSLLDFILAQNQQLQRHVFLTLEEYVSEDYRIMKQELDFLDTFYVCIYNKIEETKVIPH
jgi:hypothetical protein